MTDQQIVGRDEIAAYLGRSPKTISRWIAAGVLKVGRAGPFQNSPLTATLAVLDRLRTEYGVEHEAPE